MIKLILNDQQQSHQVFLNDLLKNAQEVYIAVAFLKMSGLKLLLPYMAGGTRFSIVVGINFGITDPVALTTLLDFMDKNTNVKGYMGSLGIHTVFHPKIYLIRDNEFCHIISGSANLTSGGMTKNVESSIYHRCTAKDDIWKEAMVFFNQCRSPGQASRISNRLIGMYLPFFKKQKPVNEQADPFPNVDSLLYDLEKLRVRYLELDQQLLTTDLDKKQERYDEAKRVLDEIAEKPLSAARFQTLLERLIGGEGKTKDKLWASNSMFRQKPRILSQQTKFRNLIRTIKNSIGAAPEIIYERAKLESRSIFGLGSNFIGEIMMTYDYEHLPNFNTNPVTVLIKDGKVDLSPYTNNYKPEQYLVYHSIIQEIAHALDLKNMLAADSIFDSIFQVLKKTGHLKKKQTA